MTHTYSISGMTCNGCVAKVKSELLKLGNVMSADVQLSPQQTTIEMQAHIPLSTLQDAVHKAGNYTISGTDTIEAPETAATSSKSYYPIFLIFGYVAGVSVAALYVHGSWDWMM